MGKKAIFLSSILIILSAILLLPIVSAQSSVTITPYPLNIPAGQNISIAIAPGAEGVGNSVNIEQNEQVIASLGTMCAESKCFSEKEFIFYVPSNWQGTYSVSYTEYIKEAGNIVARPAKSDFTVIPYVKPTEEAVKKAMTTPTTESKRYQCSFAKRYDCRHTEAAGKWTKSNKIGYPGGIVYVTKDNILKDSIQENFQYMLATKCPTGWTWTGKWVEKRGIFESFLGGIRSIFSFFMINFESDMNEKILSEGIVDFLTGAFRAVTCSVPNMLGKGDECRAFLGDTNAAAIITTKQKLSEVITKNATPIYIAPVVPGIIVSPITNPEKYIRPLCYKDYSTDYGKECDTGDIIIKTVYWDSVNGIETDQTSGWTACSSSPSCGFENTNKAGTKIAEETCISGSAKSCKSNKDCPLTEGFIATNPGCYWKTKICRDCGSGACSYNDLCYMNNEVNEIGQKCYKGSWTNEANCIDSDGGDNIYIEGTIEGPLLVTGAKPVDYCLDNSKLVEYSCEKTDDFLGTVIKGLYSKSVTCENGCANGACLRALGYIPYNPVPITISEYSSISIGSPYNVILGTDDCIKASVTFTSALAGSGGGRYAAAGPEATVWYAMDEEMMCNDDDINLSLANDVNKTIHVKEGESIDIGDLVVVNDEDEGRILELKSAGLGTSVNDVTKFRDVITGEEFEFVTGTNNKTIYAKAIGNGKYNVNVGNPGGGASGEDVNVKITWGSGSAAGNVGSETTLFPRIKLKNSGWLAFLTETEISPGNYILPSTDVNVAIPYNPYITTSIMAGKINYTVISNKIMGIKDNDGQIDLPFNSQPIVLILAENKEFAVMRLYTRFNKIRFDNPVNSSYFPITPTIDATTACINSGGTVKTSMCCKSASDFPSNCVIGACGCQPEYGHEVKTCECAVGKCWNGYVCN